MIFLKLLGSPDKVRCMYREPKYIGARKIYSKLINCTIQILPYQVRQVILRNYFLSLTTLSNGQPGKSEIVGNEPLIE